MEAVFRAVAAVPIGDMAPDWDAISRHGESKEQLLEVGPMIATVAEGDHRPLLLRLPLIGPVNLEACSIRVQPRQLQGVPPDGLADDGTIDTIQAHGPQRIERPAQTVIMEMRRIHWTLEN